MKTCSIGTDIADLTARAVVVKSKHRLTVRQRLRLAADTLKSPTCEMNENLFHRTGAITYRPYRPET